MRNWIEHCTLEWESFEERIKKSLPDPIQLESLERMRGHLNISINLWEFLQEIADHEPNMHVLPAIRIDDFTCDAIMLTAGGIYLYHILPAKVKSIRVSSENLQVQSHSEGMIMNFGESRRKFSSLANRFGLLNTPVYELYIAEVPFEGPLVLENALILNFEQLAQLFTNLVFREVSKPELVDDLLNFLRDHVYYNPNELLAPYSPNQTIEKVADIQAEHEPENQESFKEDSDSGEPLTPEDNDKELKDEIVPIVIKNQEKNELKVFIQEIQEGSKEVAPTVDRNDYAIGKQVDPQPTLPPRRRDRKKEPDSWFKLLFGKKKR